MYLLWPSGLWFARLAPALGSSRLLSRSSKKRKHNMRKTILSTTNCLLKTSILLVLSLSASGQQPTKTNTVPPLGKLVDVGGHKLHINCTGKGGPTVVMEAGSGDFSFDWSLVQPEVTRFTRVCTYDRAGKAWSELGPRPRTMKQLVHELHTLLKNARVKGPYILVGQSLGGLLARQFSAQYPESVAGVVLVDSTHEDTQLFLNDKIQRLRLLSSGKPVPAVKEKTSETDRILSADEAKQVQEIQKFVSTPKVEPPFNKLPLNIQKIRLWALSQPNHYVADSNPFMAEEFAEIYASNNKREYPLNGLPLIVLTRGVSEYPNEQAKQLDEDRRRLQTDLLCLSRNSKQIVASKSGHRIQLDAPELVISAIKQVVEAVRRSSADGSGLSRERLCPRA